MSYVFLIRLAFLIIFEKIGNETEISMQLKKQEQAERKKTKAAAKRAEALAGKDEKAEGQRMYKAKLMKQMYTHTMALTVFLAVCSGIICSGTILKIWHTHCTNIAQT